MSDIKLSEYVWVLLTPRNLIAYMSTSLQDVLDHESINKPDYKLAKVNLKLVIKEQDIIDPNSLLPDTGVRYDP